MWHFAAAGESLLVMGPSGCGKSSLLRVIAGLWTVGSGTVRGPPPQALFFLPQVRLCIKHTRMHSVLCIVELLCFI
jgi:ABC-type uncharacterized transport system fused permease/ATPase subunit